MKIEEGYWNYEVINTFLKIFISDIILLSLGHVWNAAAAVKFAWLLLLISQSFTGGQESILSIVVDMQIPNLQIKTKYFFSSSCIQVYICYAHQLWLSEGLQCSAIWPSPIQMR